MKCNICGGNNVIFTNNSVIYGKEYGKYPYIYMCKDCNSYVGVHPNNKPMGILADDEMRVLRKKCHALFDSTWHDNRERRERYSELSKKMGMKEGECHFSWMSKKMLQDALKILQKEDT